MSPALRSNVPDRPRSLGTPVAQIAPYVAVAVVVVVVDGGAGAGAGVVADAHHPFHPQVCSQSSANRSQTRLLEENSASADPCSSGGRQGTAESRLPWVTRAEGVGLYPRMHSDVLI